MTITKQQKIDAMDRIFDGSVELVSESEMALSAVEEYLDFARHVRTPAGAERFGLPIGSPIPSGDEKARYEELKKKYAHLDKIPANMVEVKNGDIEGAKAELAAKKTRSAFVKPTSAEVKTGRAAQNSMHLLKQKLTGSKTMISTSKVRLLSAKMQVDTENKATKGFKDDMGFPYSRFIQDGMSQEKVLDIKGASAPKSWALYQVDGPYQAMNGYLRHGQEKYYSRSIGTTFDGKELAAGMQKAFDEYGTNTTTPTTVFRGTRPSPSVNYAEFSPGDVFTEKGIMSTAVDRDNVMGFLDTYGMGKVSSENSVLELHLPTGQRVLGGYTGGIETMLPPGTKFKVLSNEKKNIVTETVDQSGQSVKGNVNYIVAEVV